MRMASDSSLAAASRRSRAEMSSASALKKKKRKRAAEPRTSADEDVEDGSGSRLASSGQPVAVDYQAAGDL